ncbi:MAG: PLDc N-terminal domain-containing protein [Actinomycetota bacterium]|nr:PLDc N-terminal domain-containing protein [Actinomycetota bacterium]
MPKRKWKDMTARQRTLILIAASIQLSLAATAFTDLARRPAEQVRGRKIAWVPVIMINTIGPIVYFVFGVRRVRKLL